MNRIPGVVKAVYKKMAVGDIVPPIENKDSRYGMVIISGENRDDLDSVLSIVKRTVSIEVETKDGTRGAIWN